MPAAIQRFFIVPSRQCFTRSLVVRVMEIIDSMQFVFVNDRRSRPVTPKRATVGRMGQFVLAATVVLGSVEADGKDVPNTRFTAMAYRAEPGGAYMSYV